MENMYSLLIFDDIIIDDKISNIGKEAQIVYIIIYIPACIRSGWYPQNKIIKRVGTRVASKQI